MLTPLLKKFMPDPPPAKKRDEVADLKKINTGIQALSESLATADIESVSLLQKLQMGEPMDMDDMRILANELGEIYEIVNDLLDITDEYVPPEE